MKCFFIQRVPPVVAFRAATPYGLAARRCTHGVVRLARRSCGLAGVLASRDREAGRGDLESNRCGMVEKNGEPGSMHAHASRPHHQHSVLQRSVRSPACGAARGLSPSQPEPEPPHLESASPSLYPATRPCLALPGPVHGTPMHATVACAQSCEGLHPCRWKAQPTGPQLLSVPNRLLAWLHEGSHSFASGRPSHSTYFLRGTPKKLLPSGTKKSFMGSDARTYGSSQM